jgi:hypothetical protein
VAPLRWGLAGHCPILFHDRLVFLPDFWAILLPW